ncbi:hypothetical protein HYX10_06325 [Candidatus Woesearchaeota archaeon]|nr:hypothetical protein [Candidatus Woesearchaeota archaeon]
MTLLAYSLAALIAFSGVIAGIVLAFRTKEEMSAGRKYFPWLQKILFMAAVAVLLNHFNLGMAVRAVVYGVVIVAVLKKQVLNFYPLLAAMFFLLGQSAESLFMISAIVFIYGFPTGSLFVISSGRIKLFAAVKAAVFRHGSFLAIALVLQLLYSVFVLKTFI